MDYSMGPILNIASIVGPKTATILAGIYDPIFSS